MTERIQSASDPIDPLHVVAWGQYVHWAQLQFERFVSMDENCSDSERTGIVAHWLAAEYVVLEGWRELGFTGSLIPAFIRLYPENCDALRLCRNAVYHFQRQILDDRIVRILQDKNEELLWAAAMHCEFQNFLFMYPHTLPGSFEERKELAEEMTRCIAWEPNQSLKGSLFRVLEYCRRLEEISAMEDGCDSELNRELVSKTLKGIEAIERLSLANQLSRWPLR